MAKKITHDHFTATLLLRFHSVTPRRRSPHYLTYSQISHLLGISAGSVQNLCRRAQQGRKSLNQ